MFSLSSAHTEPSEQTQLNKDSDTVHQEANYADEYSRTLGQPESQRDPTMFPNTDQDNVVDMSANDTNTAVQEMAKSFATADMNDNHSKSKADEHSNKHEKTVHHSPTRRKSITNQTHKNTNDHSNTQGKTANHSPTRRKSINHDTHKDASDHSNTQGKTTNHSPTRRKSITHDTHTHADAHGKTDHHSPTRRKSVTHDAHAHTEAHEKTTNHSPTRRKSITTNDTHGTRRKSNAHEHEKEQLHESEKIEHGDTIIANTGTPTQTITDASSSSNKPT